MYEMPYIKPDKLDHAAKTSKWRDIVDIFNKNVSVEDYETRFEAKNAKTGQNTVNTAEISKKLQEKSEREYLKAYGRPRGTPVSCPNPNTSFKRKKEAARVHKYISNVPKPKEEESLWPEDWDIDDD